MRINVLLSNGLFAFAPPTGAQRVDSRAALYADPRRGPDLRVGQAAPPIACPDLDGKPLSLSQYRGRGRSFCPPPWWAWSPPGR